MRRAALAAVALVALAVVAALLFAWGLPGLVDRSGLRERIDTFAQQRLGRRLTYQDFEVGLLPPRVEVRGLTLAARAPSDPPALTAERASFAFSWASLLSAQLTVDRVDVEGAALRVVRTPEGFDGLAAALPAAPALPSPEAGGGRSIFGRPSYR